MPQRDDLITANRDYAHALARQIHKKLPRHIEFDDVAAFADMGLIEAADHFDPAQGVAFKTFSYYRIRGAVFDGIRKLTGLTREVREEVTIGAGANAVEEEVLAGEPTDDPEQLASRLHQVVTRTMVVVLLSQMGDGEQPLEPVHEETPAKKAELKESVQRVADAIRQLPENQVKLLELHYFRQQSLTDCGKVFNKDKATMTRWHQAALHALKEMLGVREPERLPSD